MYHLIFSFKKITLILVLKIQLTAFNDLHLVPFKKKENKNQDPLAFFFFALTFVTARQRTSGITGKLNASNSGGPNEVPAGLCLAETLSEWEMWQ